MAANALQLGMISEAQIKDALTTARGDLFIAAAYLRVRPRELDGFIRLSEPLQLFVAAIDNIKASPEYNKLSLDQFADKLTLLTAHYRADALDVIHELATMPFESAAMADVKLKAAMHLAGSNNPAAQAPNEQNAILAELNRQYHQTAPRIKTVRVAQIEFQDDGA